MNKKDKDVLLSRTVPSRQKQVQEYLEGRSPGTMQRYAPDAHADAQEGWVETDQTVQEIAASLCFSTRNYFSRIFQEVTGQTPMEYRQG